MSLSELVKKYLAISGGYGKYIAISSLGLSRSEAEKAFDILDEDYHISRFFQFRNEQWRSVRDQWISTNPFRD